MQTFSAKEAHVRWSGFVPSLTSVKLSLRQECFFLPIVSVPSSRHWMLLSLPAFEEEVVGLLPSLAAGGVGGDAGKWAKVHFNWAVFTSHVCVTIRIKGIGKNLSCTITTYLIERCILKRRNKLIMRCKAVCWCIKWPICTLTTLLLTLFC